MLEPILGWPVLGFIIALLIGAGFSVLSMGPPRYRIAEACFSIAGLILWAKFAYWAVTSNSSLRERIFVSFVIFGISGALLIWGLSWIDGMISEPGAMSIMAAPRTTDYPVGTRIAGILWNRKYSELRVRIGNYTSSDFDNMDILLQPDGPVAGIGQITDIPNASFLINTTISIAPELVDSSSGQRRAVRVVVLAFNRGYRVLCPKLPRQSYMEILIAIAWPTGKKGIAVTMSDGSTYWARTDVDDAKSLDDYFGEKQIAKSIQVEGSYEVNGQPQHVSVHPEIRDSINDLIHRLMS
jgi:hypothetical protein